MSSQHEEPVVNLAELIRAALEVVPDDEVGGMTRLMQAVADATGSYGCCLWRKRAKKEDFVMLAGWDRNDGRISLSRMSVANTCAGRALDKGQCRVDDLVAGNNPNAYHPYLVRLGINRTIACRVEVPCSKEVDDDGWCGALNLYRRGPRPDWPANAQDDGEFTEDDLARLKTICASIPLLFRATRDRDALELFRTVEKIIAAYQPPKNALEWEENLKATIEKFGHALQRGFRCLELSIFLRRTRDPREYRCWFTTEGAHKADAEKTIYKQGKLRGFSSLSLLVDETIRVADIRHPEDEEAAWKDKNPEFPGHVNKGISDKTLALEGLTDKDAPPHSMMCCRLEAGGEVFGLVRCRVRLYGPVTYHAEDGRLLYMVCQSFSQNLAGWWEAHHWDEFTENVGAYEVLSGQPRHNQHLAQALELIERVVPGADVNTARLLDSNEKNLHFVAARERVEAELQKEARTGLKESFPVNESVAREILQTKKAKRYREDERIKSSFRDIQEFIFAPIQDHKRKIYGILDARSRTAFPPYAGRLMEIIGRFVGMQHAQILEDEKGKQNVEALAKHREEQQATELQLMQKSRDDDRRTVQAFEDAAHQIKTPLNAARKLVEISNRCRIPMDIGLLETSLRRADLASKLINTFADIAGGRSPYLGKQDLVPEELVRLILVLSSDVARSSNEDRRLKFEVNEASILRYSPRILAVDKDLIAEAIYNLLDNAEKYSHLGGTIRVFGLMSRGGKFCVAVTNKGERIDPGEEHECLKRRWRSPRLAGKTGSGSGLGLYIVDSIMKAHAGRVVVVPTDKDGVTEIRLEF